MFPPGPAHAAGGLQELPLDSLSLTAMQWIGWGVGLGFLFAFGACAGSFLNVVVYRLPSGLSVVSPPSRCPKCGARLRWFDNIPIVSWLLLRGRCRRCATRISLQYPLVEIVGGTLVAGLAALLYLVPTTSFWSAIGGEWWFQQTIARSWPAFICWSVTLLGLLGMTVIDARTYTIPILIPLLTTVTCWVLWPIQALLPVSAEVVGQWPIPQMGWPATVAAFGGLAGVMLGLGLLRVGVLRYSFHDYEEYVPEGEVLAQYPHARREMFVELLYLLPCMAGLAIGWLVGVGLEGRPPLVIMALAASIGGWIGGCAIVWTLRILGTLGFGREAMGSGDVHLLGAVGAGFGWVDPVIAFFIAPFSGLTWVLLRMVGGRFLRGLWKELPYGPHLAIAVLLVVFLRPVLLDVGRELFPGLFTPSVERLAESTRTE